MAIFAISDLHLSLGGDKPMSVFGSRWENYTDKMARRLVYELYEKRGGKC